MYGACFNDSLKFRRGIPWNALPDTIKCAANNRQFNKRNENWTRFIRSCLFIDEE